MSTYVFGPVPSRRLGNSLGIDLTPTKTCSFNCIYCQLSKTQFHTIERKEFCPINDVLAELKTSLADIAPDWITISGTGEPTLYSKLGSLLRQIKEMTSIPICVITNGSLMYMPEVRADLMLADRILPTLTTVVPETYNLIHQPAKGLELEKILSGLSTFLEDFKGTTELEVFICPEINDSLDEITKLRSFILSLPFLDSVYLNTSIRNPLSKDLSSAEQSSLDKIRSILDLKIPVTTAFEHSHVPQKRLQRQKKAGHNEILKLLLRHPSNEQQLEQVLDLSTDELSSLLGDLQQHSKIHKTQNGDWSLYP